MPLSISRLRFLTVRAWLDLISVDGVVRLWLVGINRGREANPVVSRVADGLLSSKFRQVAEHLDELEADRVRRNKQPLEVAIELRLPADKLNSSGSQGHTPRV